MSSMRKLITILALFLLSVSCAKKDTEIPCEGESNCSNLPSSAVDIPNQRQLTLEFLTSSYYDTNSRRWIKIEPDEEGHLELGVLPIFSDLITTGKLEAMDSVILSDEQESDPQAWQAEEFNSIPYIKIKIESDSYVRFYYKKQNNLGVIVQDMTGEAIIRGEYAYIPLVNEMFGNKLQSTTIGSSNTESLDHYIEVVGLADNVRKSEIRRIHFKLDPQSKLKGAYIEYSPEAENFNLKNRWSHYFNEVDYSPNRNFVFASLIDAQENPDAIPYDVKFVFKDEPTLIMTQTVFVERNIDTVLYPIERTIFIARGDGFIQDTQTFTSQTDFRKKILINGQTPSNSNGSGGERELTLRNIPSMQKWNLSFVFDFLKNENYTPGQELLSPLKPVCAEITGQSFLPIHQSSQRDSNIQEGGYTSVCHPDSNKMETVAAEDLETTPLALEDLWYDFFNYRKDSVILDTPTQKIVDAGLFTGLKNVSMQISGCVRIYTREASALETNPNPYDLRNESSPECEDSTSASEGGWLYFSIQKEDNIFNHRQDERIKNNSQLIRLIEDLMIADPEVIPNMRFNSNTSINRIF